MSVYKKVIDSFAPESLLEEFFLIQKKESKLSKDQRDYVLIRLKKLIEKGVIKVETEVQDESK